VAINCSAIPETLLEAELFGHARGRLHRSDRARARDGSSRRTRGTLFLDEVGTMSPACRPSCCACCRKREFERVGDAHTIKIDVRIIAATHLGPAKMVAEDTFREDPLLPPERDPGPLPALRERREDVPLLVQHFLQKLGAEQVPPRSVDDVAGRAAAG
jgi:transcriptional regulator with GAF, ATPase, and Fis domain